jgi:DUF4097 and DUF4098 domain-containing protein YvlB
MVADMQKLMQMHQMTTQENGQLKQMLDALTKELNSKDKELQVKADGQVLQAQTAAHDTQMKAQTAQSANEMDLVKTLIQENNKMHQHQQKMNATPQRAQLGMRLGKDL